MTQYRHETKCIYCQRLVGKRNRSVEHVIPKCMLQKETHALTLKNHVCRTCNSSFYFETFFSELTDIALMNQEVKCDLDNTSIPEGFFAEDFSKRRVNGKEFLKPYVSSVQIDQSLNRSGYRDITFDPEAQKQIMRGMAKIGLNALLVKYQKTRSDFFILEHEKINFSGHEDEFSQLKDFITGEIAENKFVARIEALDDPCLVGLSNEHGNPISPNAVSQTMHMVDIHRYEGLFFCFVTLFLGLENPGAIFCVSLNSDLPAYADINPIRRVSERVRTILFYYQLSRNSPIKKKRFESFLIQPVNNPMWIGIINNTRN